MFTESSLTTMTCNFGISWVGRLAELCAVDTYFVLCFVFFGSLLACFHALLETRMNGGTGPPVCGNKKLGLSYWDQTM
jgi:hypothetical protein